MLNFDKFINTDVETTPFEMVVFGQGGSVLEVELNEVQALIYQKFRRLFYTLGNISSKDSVTYSNGTVTLNGVFILNGYLFECDNISIPASDGDHVYVTINTGVASKDSTIRKKGYVDGDVIDNTILDPRWGAETSRRRIIEFSVSTTDTSGIEIAKIDGGNLSLTGVATISNSNSKYPIANIIGLREELDTKANTSSLTSHTSDKSNPHEVTKTQIGLGSVDNKSSETIRSEITSSNVTDALGYKPLNSNLKGSKDGVAELDSNGKVLSSQLPSYVDDVIEGYLSGGKFYKESAHTTEISGESGKIYIDLHTGKTYRWSGSTFGVISETLALGETSSTAYRGDRGKVAYDHSQTAHAPSNAQANVQSDWNATSGDAFIKNKPTIPTKVGELTNDKDYATKTDVTEAIDDIEIGGRNLLVGTKDFNITNVIGSVSGYSKVISEKYNGLSVRYYNLAWNFYRPVILLKKGTYTFSTYAKGTDGLQMQIYIENDVEVYNLSSNWERYTLVFDVEEDKEVTIYCESIANGDIYQCGWKLENGNKATPWTPAIEDTEAEIQAVDNKLTTNLLKPTLGTVTKNGVTFTNNGDGTYTLNGTAIGENAVFEVNINRCIEYGKTYRLVGCPQSGGSGKYGLEATDQIIYGVNDYGDGAIFNPYETGHEYKMLIVVYKNYTVNNLVFKPMLTTNLNATYDDFVPYTGSTGQINSDVAEVRKDFDEHTHEIADVTGLQNALDGKANASHTHTKSQIDDFPTSLPASDVYDWAKANSKPSYTWDEIGSKPSYVDMLALKGGTILGSKNSVGSPDGYIAEIEFASGRFADLNVSATIYNGKHVVYPEEKGTWTPSNTPIASTDTSVYKFEGSEYRKIGDIVILTTTAVPTNYESKEDSLVIASDSFPFASRRILSTFASNPVGKASIGVIGGYGQIYSFGKYNFQGDSGGLTNVNVGIIYLL